MVVETAQKAQVCILAGLRLVRSLQKGVDNNAFD